MPRTVTFSVHTHLAAPPTETAEGLGTMPPLRRPAGQTPSAAPPPPCLYSKGANMPSAETMLRLAVQGRLLRQLGATSLCHCPTTEIALCCSVLLWDKFQHAF